MLIKKRTETNEMKSSNQIDMNYSKLLRRPCFSYEFRMSCLFN